MYATKEYIDCGCTAFKPGQNACVTGFKKEKKDAYETH